MRHRFSRASRASGDSPRAVSTMLQCVVTNAAPFCPVWESCLIGLLAKVSMEREVAKNLLCIGPKSPRTVTDFLPLNNEPAIVRSIRRLFERPPGAGHASRPASSQCADDAGLSRYSNSACRHCTVRLHLRASRFCRRCASDASYEAMSNARSIDETTTDISLATDSV